MMTPYLLLALTVSWSFALATAASVCVEPLVRRCRCGDSERYQDVYVTSCRVYTADNSSICEPCPGSCGAYELCQTCSKEGCLSCPPGRFGKFCENTETAEAKKLNPSEASEDMKSYVQEESQANFGIFPPKPEKNSNFKNLPQEEITSKDQSNENDRNPIAVTGNSKTNGNTEYLNNDMEMVLYEDVFGSNVNPEISQSFVNRTKKFASEQKPKETLTVMRDSFKEIGRHELLPPTIRDKKATDDKKESVISLNGSLIHTNDSFNSSPKVVLNFYSEVINSSEYRDLNEKVSQTNLDTKLDDSSIERKIGFRFPKVNDNDSLGHGRLGSSYESPEVKSGANLEDKEKLNTSDIHWQSPFVDKEAQVGDNIEQHESVPDVMVDQQSERMSNGQSGWSFNLKDAQFSSLSFPFEKQISLHSSEPEIEQDQMSNQSDNPRTNPIDHRLPLAGNSGVIEGKVFPIPSNKQSNLTAKVLKTDEIQIPLNVSVFKVKVIDPNGDESNADASRQPVEVKTKTKSSETSEDKMPKLYENDSKEFDIISPLAISIFNITFLNDANGTLYRSNLTERRIVGDSEKLAVSQKKTTKISGNITTGLKDFNSERSMILPAAILKENNGSSSNESNQNDSARFAEEKKKTNIKKKTSNHKRNVTDRQQDELLYNDILYNMLRTPPEFIANNAQKYNDKQLHSSQSFSKTNIPENQVLIPLYIPEIYNPEQYRSFTDNGCVKTLCDLFPNYSPCFRARILALQSPNLDKIVSQPQFSSKDYQHNSSPNTICAHHLHQLSPYDLQGNSNIQSNTGNEQNLSIDLQILNLIKEYFQSKYAQTSLLPLQNPQVSDNAILSKLRLLIQGRIKERASKEVLGSPLLNLLMNNVLRILLLKSGGDKPATPNGQEFLNSIPEQPVSILLSNSGGNKPATPNRQEFLNSIPEQLVSSLLSKSGGNKPATPNRQEFLNSIPEEPEVENEVEDFTLNANQPLQPGSISDSRRFDNSNSVETDSEFCVQNNTSSGEKIQKTGNILQIKIFHPIFDQTSFEKDGDGREKSYPLQSAEDTLFESCPNCVFSESSYETNDGEEQKPRPLPTIFRALIVEEGLFSGNQSDSNEQNSSRSKRSMFNYDMQNWCPIQKRMLNGDLDCTIWSYQKVCNLICHRGYSSRASNFKCARSTQTWSPSLEPCLPAQRYRGFGYRDFNSSSLERDLDLLPDGNFNDTSFDNNSQYAGDRNQTLEDYEGLPGFRESEATDNSTLDKRTNFPDKMNNSNAFPGFSGEVAPDDKIVKTGDNADIVMDGKDVEAPEDAESKYEKKPPVISSSKTKYRPEEKKTDAEDTVYSYFEKGDSEPKPNDSW